MAIGERIEWSRHQASIWLAAMMAATAGLLFIGSKLNGEAQFRAKAEKMRESIAKGKERR